MVQPSTDIPAPLLASSYKKELEVAHQAALEAGAVIATAFRQPKNITEKLNAADLVTETDKQSEHLILGRIQAAFPDHHFIGEEGTAAQGFASELSDEPTWMCDPLDGTTNFVHSFPMVCISLALAVSNFVFARKQNGTLHTRTAATLALALSTCDYTCMQKSYLCI